MTVKTFFLKLNVTGLLLCCMYVVYMTFINVVPGTESSFGILIPGYFAGAMGHLLLRRFKCPLPVRWVGPGLTVFYFIALLMVLAPETFLSWAISQVELFLVDPNRAIHQNFGKLTIAGVGASLLYFGWIQAVQKNNFSAVFRQFQMGFTVLFAVLIIANQLAIEVAMLPHAVVLFFILGLMGLIFSRENQNDPSADLGKMLQARIQYAVLGLLLIVTASVSFLFLIQPDAVEKMLDLVRLMQNWFLVFVDFMMNLFPVKGASRSFDLDIRTSFTELIRSKSGAVPAQDTKREMVRVLYLLSCSGFLLYIFWRASASFVAFLIKQNVASSGVACESMQGAFKADLSRWVVRQIHKIQKSIKRFVIWAVQKLSLSSLFPGVVPHTPLIGMIYIKMLKWSSKRGVGRQLNQTPAEHAGMLKAKTPELTDTIDVVTRFYEKYRYGKMELNLAEQDILMNGWQKIKKYKLNPGRRRI